MGPQIYLYASLLSNNSKSWYLLSSYYMPYIDELMTSFQQPYKISNTISTKAQEDK